MLGLQNPLYCWDPLKIRVRTGPHYTWIVNEPTKLGDPSDETV